MNPLAIFIGALLLVLGAGDFAQGKPPKKAPVPAAPAAPAPPVVTARVLEKDLTETFAYQLRAMILKRLLEEFAAKEKIEVTEAEVTQSLRLSDATAAFNLAFFGTKEDLEELLASKRLTKDERARAKETLRLYNETVAEREERRKSGEARKDAVESIYETKVSQALYKKYGGRVAKSDGVPDPLDAQRDFLVEQEKKGAFEILDEKLRREFWAQDKLNEQVRVMTNEESWIDALKTPWWTTVTEEQLRRVPTRQPVLLSYAEGKKIAGDFEGALDLCAREVRLHPGESCGLTWRARAYLERKELDQALADARRAAEMAPSRKCFVLGEVLEALGKPEEALPHYQAAYEGWDDGWRDWSVVLKLAPCLFKLGKYEAVGAVLSKILEINSNEGKDVDAARILLGEVRLKLNKFAAAEELFTKVIEHDVMKVEAWRGRAVAREALEKTGDAAADARMAAQLELKARAKEKEAAAARPMRPERDARKGGKR